MSNYIIVEMVLINITEKKMTNLNVYSIIPFV